MEICNIYYNGTKILETENEGGGGERIKITLKFIVLATKSMPILLTKQEKEGVGSGIWGRHILNLRCQWNVSKCEC